MEFAHIPVLLEQCLDGLDIKPDGIYFDGTCGGAGHSREIAKRLTTGRLIGIDRDPDAVAVASERLSGLPAQVVRGNYSEIKQIADDLGICGADGILLDLGVSSVEQIRIKRLLRGYGRMQNSVCPEMVCYLPDGWDLASFLELKNNANHT